jgi:hypothetical protein
MTSHNPAPTGIGFYLSNTVEVEKDEIMKKYKSKQRINVGRLLAKS